jgi:hypothetical protein
MTEAFALLLSTVISAAVAYWVSERSAKAAAKVAREELKQTNRNAQQAVEATLKTADQQIKASVLAGNRQAWINTLREEMADLADAILFVRMEWIESEERGRSALERNRERIFKRYMKISLLINPSEEDHSELVSKIDEILPKISGESAGEVDFFSWQREFVALSQRILKHEWERVKRLE